MSGSPDLRYICALVTYDGTDYHGFQYQVGVPTIQETLETALDAFTERASRIVGAGRTDAGVHANGQVIAVTVRWQHGLEDLRRAWNVRLPPSVAVRRVRSVPVGFHPRISALCRTYRYTVQHYVREGWMAVPRRSPLTDRYSVFETRRLDLDAMRQAADELVGRHDFATFGQPPQGESTVRTVYQAEWQAVKESLSSLDPYPGERLVFTITANGFLRQMVRNLVGSLLAVGRGEWSDEDLRAALAARNRSRSAPPAPAKGLVLEAVTYPGELDALIHGNSESFWIEE